MTRPSTGYRSTAATVGSIYSSAIEEIITSTSLNNPPVSKPTNSAIDLTAPGDEDNRVIEEENFEEVDELEEEELDPAALAASGIGDSELDGAIKQWPRVNLLELKYQILEKGILFKVPIAEFIANIRYELKVFQIWQNFSNQSESLQGRTTNGTCKFYTS